MKRLIAWRILVDEKGRSVLAVGGIFAAFLLIFLQLGFYFSVPKGGLLFYDRMQFDLMLVSSAYVSQAHSGEFPRRRLYQAFALPEVARTTALYQASGHWTNPQAGVERDIFVMAFDPDDPVFDVPEIVSAHDVLRQPDTILVDINTRPEFGPLRPGRVVEIENRAVKIGGIYDLGTGFLGRGGGVISSQNFIRLYPARTLSQVNLGLVTLKPAMDPERVAAKIRAIMPADTLVLTREELARHEIAYWLMQTSTGLVFGFGVVVGVIVGLVILDQTLSSQINRRLPEYATLKAMGYTNRDLSGIVGSLAIVIVVIGYIPALVAAIVIYSLVRDATSLPVEMTETRAVVVLVVAAGMSVGSALLALRSLRRADPVDLF